jgi:hypothetical protein
MKGGREREVWLPRADPYQIRQKLNLSAYICPMSIHTPCYKGIQLFTMSVSLDMALFIII